MNKLSYSRWVGTSDLHENTLQESFGKNVVSGLSVIWTPWIWQLQYVSSRVSASPCVFLSCSSGIQDKLTGTLAMHTAPGLQLLNNSVLPVCWLFCSWFHGSLGRPLSCVMWLVYFLIFSSVPLPPLYQLATVGQRSGSVQPSSIWLLFPYHCSGDQPPLLLQWEQLKEISKNNITPGVWFIAAPRRVCSISVLTFYALGVYMYVCVCVCPQMQARLFQPTTRRPSGLPALFLLWPLAGLHVLQSLCCCQHHFWLYGRYSLKLQPLISFSN